MFYRARYTDIANLHREAGHYKKKATAGSRVIRYLSVGHSICVVGSRNPQEDEAMGIIEYVLLGLVAVTGV
ncbi:MAG TPA: hypothetical protein DCX61_09980, partial [Gemmatimonadetes bacterium]|nr:hypothetical protein [Gemmatimonadota bacterium]